MFNEELIRACFEAARRARCRISLDLASYTVVESSLPALRRLVPEFVDILIANEDEACAYTGRSEEADALEQLCAQADTAALKLGARGSMVARAGRVTRVEPLGGGEAVDTTGAGDLWASGFLFGLAHGYDITQAGALASACGYEVCQIVGAHVPDEGWERIRSLL
jgi:sugar/nucleoside kinase (ribokinase family)